MSNFHSLISYDHPATDDEKRRILLTAHAATKRLYHRKAKGGYLCYCTRCRSEYLATAEQFQQIKEAQLCFKCANEIKTVQESKRIGTERRSWICIANELHCLNGYEVIWKTVNCRPVLIRCDHVLHFDSRTETTYLYRIVKTMSWSLGTLWDRSKWKWRKERVRAYSYRYRDFFRNVHESEEEANQTRRSFYEDVMIEGMKSNQLTFIKKGIYNENQLTYIWQFDLNYPEELHKYANYINMHTLPESNLKLNVHYLDYLVREHRNVRLFFDYAHACKRLNEKVEKPRDLVRAHDLQIAKIDALDAEKHAERIEKLYSLKRTKEWGKGVFEIHAFRNYDEMQRVADMLHNCIGKMYVKPYAEQRTDVYFGTKNGIVTFALEIARNRLVQLRADYNKSVDKETRDFVYEWCKRFKYATS